MIIGIGVGINRQRYMGSFSGAYQSRVTADGAIVESISCVGDASSLLQSASLLLIPSGYKGGKLYSEIPTNGNGDLTWTRGSDAFRTNASGVLQRMPWNLARYSEEFENAVWTKSATTLSANTTVAPNGTTTADTLIENTANSSHQIFQSITNVNGATPYTAMIYVKENANRNVAIRIQDGAFTYGQVVVTYNLNTGALISQVATGNGVVVSTSATLTNGYYLIAVSFSINLSTSFRYDVLMVNGTSNSYTGDGTSSIFIWGAQLVEGTTAQTYLPTTDRLNFPRLSYMYGSCPSALLEPQRTNLLTYSEQFDNSAWSVNTATVTPNTEISPSGLMNADTITNISGSLIGQNPSLATIGQIYTFSIYIKRINGNGSINLVDVNGNLVPITITNEWKRYNVTATASSTSLRAYFRVMVTGDSIAAWGAQLEAGAYPTTYIPTTTASATRIADSFSRSNIYTNGLITSSGGTWFVELRGNVSLTRDTGANLNQSLGITDSSGNGIVLRSSGTQRHNVSKYITNTPTELFVTTTDTVKIAIKWNGSTMDIFQNGSKVVSASTFTTTNLTTLGVTTSDIPKFIQAMALYPSPLSDTDCTTLTTL